MAYFKKLTEDRIESTGNHGNWLSAYYHFKKYTNNSCTFNDLTQELVQGFKEYLLTEKINRDNNKLSQNSALSYLNKLKAAINNAFEARLIEENPAKRVKGIKQDESRREYLTYEEVKKLYEAECRYPLLKTAFLFSVLTGLRWSDINKLLWTEIQFSDANGWSINFKQKKTKDQEYLPITVQARELLGKKSDVDKRVFKGLKYSAHMNIGLAQWVIKAGITKQITFHCARHTHATLLLTNGVDLYTVSKLLGHRNMKTTQIYGRIIDQKKIEAVNSLPQF